MSIQLTKLCHDVVQNSYKDLHALLDSIGDDDIPTRHKRFVEHILTQRHRFARLLVAVRWFMSYSAFHYSAQATRDLGAKRSNVMNHGADTLWAVSGVVRGAAAHASAVQEAAEVLGAASYLNRIPRCIESGVGVDTLADAFDVNSDDSSEAQAPHAKSLDRMDVENSDRVRDEPPHSKPSTGLNELESEAVARLRAATADLASRSLPEGVKLIQLGVEPSGAAVRLGVPGAWTADVVLDRLLVSEAFFVLLRFNIMVDSSPDAVSDIKRRHYGSERALPLTKEQQEPLRQMLDDRMRWAALNVKDSDVVERARKVLHCLCVAMSYECCGKLALHHIRAQCSALVSRGIWSNQDVSVTEPGKDRDSVSPIHVRYWQRSFMAGTVVLSVASEQVSAGASEPIANVVTVQSSAALHSNEQLLNPMSLDVEHLLLRICRDRALDVMTSLIRECTALLPRSASMRTSRSSTSVISLILMLQGEAPELIFGISLRTGGVLVRCCGTLARSLAHRSSHVRRLKELLWGGERFFSKATQSLFDALRRIVEKAVAAFDDVTREANVLQEKSKKARFAVTDSPEGPQPKRHPSMTDRTNNLSNDIGSPRRPFHIEIPGKNREPGDEAQEPSARTMAIGNARRQEAISMCMGRAASALARADETVHSQAIETLRGLLTREMQTLKIVTPLHSNTASTRAGKTQLPIKTMPMETESATLSIRGSHGWALRLILRQNLFDAVSAGGVVSYARKTKTLTFAYPSISKKTVHCFRKDLIRARTAAALVTGLTTNPGIFKIRCRRPTHVTVEVGKVVLSAGLGRRSVEVDTYPPTPIISAQLIPLIEEVLNDAGMEMGQRFAELLNRSLPIGQAIQSIVPEDPKKFRVRFSTALRARYVIAHVNAHKRTTYAVDIDARSGRDRMMLIDVARAHKVTSNSKSSSAGHQFSPIPMWETVLNKLSAKERGRPVHDGAAVQIPTSILPNVLSVTVGKFR